MSVLKDDFWSRVPRRATKRVQDIVVVLQDVGNTKVSNHQRGIFTRVPVEEVFWFEVLW